MGKLQKLNESVQALEGRLNQAYGVISGYTNSFATTKNSINPLIVNSVNYSLVLAVMDRIQVSGRYITDIPELNLASNKLEQLWYTYGSLCFYRENGRPFVAMYSKEGGLSRLGDLTKIAPIDFAGVKHNTCKTVVYDSELSENPCVIINDYSGTYTEGQIIPRASLNSVSIFDQTEVYRQLKNSIKLTAKKAVVLLESPTQRAALEQSVSDLLNNESPVMGIVGKSLNDAFKLHNLDTKLDIDGYIRAIDTYERLRANFNGIRTRAPLEKKANLLESETENDNAITDIFLHDGYIQRQVGIEQMKMHAIITSGSVKINPMYSTIMEKKEEPANADTKNKRS